MEIKIQPISKKRRFACVMSFLSFASLFAGLIVTFSSASLARSAGSSAIRAAGGSMDTAQFLLVIENSARAYTSGGVVLALIGGIGLLVGAVMFYITIDG